MRGGTATSQRAVFWFDLSTVPAGKTLKTAKLQITVVNNPGQDKTRIALGGDCPIPLATAQGGPQNDQHD